MEQEAAASANEPRGGEEHEPIVFSLQQDPPDKLQSALDEEREKHKRRAERFGTSYVDPGRVRKDFTLMMEARKERLRANHGFTTGDLDVFSTEEREKRAARAARFQLEVPLGPSLDTYKPDEEQEARARRAVKFGVPYQPTDAVLMDMDLYEQRREVGKDIERRPDAIYLYGVDVMSTREVLSYFSEYGPVFVEWLDDSSCNVVFSDANSAKRALVGKGTPLPPEVVTEAAGAQQLEGTAGGPESEAAAAAIAPPAVLPVRYQPELPVPNDLTDVTNLPYVWHKGQDFVKEGTPLSLVYRMATVLDVRDMNQPKRTRQLWKEAGGGGRRGGRGGRGGRGQDQQHRLGKRPYRRGGDGEGPTDMDVDDGGPGSNAGADEDGDVPMKRPRGARGGQRLVMKEVRPALQPYGGTSLLQPGGAVLPAKGHVLDYTELEDEDPAAAAQAEAAAAAARQGSGAEATGRGRRQGRMGWRGGGGARAGFDGDLRELLKARKKALLKQNREHGDENGGDGIEGDGGDGEDAAGEEGEFEHREGDMDEQ